MVARPSLKRVVPGSVPPWRALCAESARALKAFLSVLCVSRKFLNVLLLESNFGQILRALNLQLSGSGPRARAWAARAAGPCRSFCGLVVARPGSVPPARACFSWPRRCFGLPQRFSWPCRGFPLPAIKKARQPFVIVTLDPLSEHFRGRSATYCSPFVFAARRSVTYFVGRAARARAFSPLCFRCVRVVDLRWCGSWPLVAGLGGWD